MRHLLYLLSLLLLQAPALPAQESGPELLKKMHGRYYRAFCREYTFSQRNTHYRNDTVIGQSEWHEAVSLPDRFLIRFGEPAKGNFVVFRNDSVFHFRKSQLVKSSADTNTLLLLLGGMYYRELPDVKERLAKAGFDLSRTYRTHYNQQSVVVLGANKGETERNQIWVHTGDLRILRIVEKLGSGDWMDMSFDAHQPWCKGFVETKVSFRRNGALEQVEEYYDLKEAPWPLKE